MHLKAGVPFVKTSTFSPFFLSMSVYVMRVTKYNCIIFIAFMDSDFCE